MNKVIKVIKSPLLIISYFGHRGWFKFIPDKLYLEMVYKARLKKDLNLKNPRNFNEKLQWLKLYYREPIMVDLVDKFKVRKYVSDIIGEKYLNELYGCYDRFNDINFSELPDSFVIKVNHDSGGIIMIEDKNNVNHLVLSKKVQSLIKKNYYYSSREWPYKNIKPRIIIEKYLKDDSSLDLKDYKIHCFSGKPEFIQVDYDRFSTHKKNLYSTSWEFMDVSYNYPFDKRVIIDKPKKLEEMLELARKLSIGFPYVRVDFYIVNEKILFGEITFYPVSGFGIFTPESYNDYLGDLIELPQRKELYMK